MNTSKDKWMEAASPDLEQIYVVMGVSGSGKSTIAPLLASSLDLPFFDGDAFHPPANVAKMAAQIPLNDEDRYAWLIRLNALARKHSEKGAVLVCSALKESYRDKLGQGLAKPIVWIYLKGSYDLILSRLRERKGHFMPVSLLESQFATLEEPKGAITVSITGTPEEITAEILRRIRDASGKGGQVGD